MKKQLISDEEFVKICVQSMTMREASKKLNLSFTTFKRRAEKLGCYKTNQGGKGTKKGPNSTRLKTEDILNGLYPEYNTFKLKRRLINEGIKEDKCELCGWNKKPEGAEFTPCELHHKDGNPHNHTLDNLIILCPNCHSLTNNYRFRTRVPKEKSLE